MAHARIHNTPDDIDHVGCVAGCPVKGERMYIQDALNRYPDADICPVCLPYPDANAHDVVVERLPR